MLIYTKKTIGTYNNKTKFIFLLFIIYYNSITNKLEMLSLFFNVIIFFNFILK
jgi:hypothetical protein